MQSLEKRIAALERTVQRPDEIILIRRFVSPGDLHPAIVGLRANDGERWELQPGESEQGLIDRATSEAKRNPWGVVTLTAEH